MTKERLTGRELDAAIARDVMGFQRVHNAFDLGEPVTGEWYYYSDDGDIPLIAAYSTDLNRALAAMAALRKQGMEEKPWSKPKSCTPIQSVSGVACVVCGQPMYPQDGVVHLGGLGLHHEQCCGKPDQRQAQLAAAFMDESDKKEKTNVPGQ